MAKVTCKGLTYAKYSSGGEASAVTYTGGTALTDYLCKVDIGENRGDVKEYADGHKIDAEKQLSEVTLALELANISNQMKQDILGHKAATSETQVTDADPPFVGIGFILKNRFKGTVTYEGYWFYKMQFVSAGLSSSTRQDQTQFEHETINGTGVGVTLSSGGDTIFYVHKDGESTEAAIRTWLNTLAGVSSSGGGGGSP